MKPKAYRVSLAFANGSYQALMGKADSVSLKMFGLETFNDPPVTKIQLDAAIAATIAAKAAMAQGGTAATSEKNDRVDELKVMMRQLAIYVQSKAQYNLTTLLSSTFDAVNGSGPREPLTAPMDLRTKNGMTGQALVTVKAVKNARGYEPQYALLDAAGAPGPWMDGLFSTSSLNMPVSGLTPGSLYILRVRAMGGSTSQSNWSEVISHRAN